jgi:hypothetical protein
MVRNLNRFELKFKANSKNPLKRIRYPDYFSHLKMTLAMSPEIHFRAVFGFGYEPSEIYFGAGFGDFLTPNSFDIKTSSEYNCQ